jgi:hypothetical protein
MKIRRKGLRKIYKIWELLLKITISLLLYSKNAKNKENAKSFIKK